MRELLALRGVVVAQVSHLEAAQLHPLCTRNLVECPHLTCELLEVALLGEELAKDVLGVVHHFVGDELNTREPYQPQRSQNKAAPTRATPKSVILTM